MKKYMSLIVIIAVLAVVAVFNSVINTSKEEEHPAETGHSHDSGPKVLDATLIFNKVMVLETTSGNVEIAILKKDIPKASSRMLYLAKKDLFKDTRVIKANDWHVQFAEVSEDMNPLPLEQANNLLSCNYAVGLAHKKSVDSGTTSIFIIREPSFSVINSYTIFGYVVKGQDVVKDLTEDDSIVASSVRAKTPEDDKALVDIMKQGNLDHGLATQFEMKATAEFQMEAAKKMSDALPGELDR
ncbi:MAG: peptidylprolyl isomerase [Abditibacteriota bacterium]|nr:peptidylprolyl isomerase [Abditibacteriota bacterium]